MLTGAQLFSLQKEELRAVSPEEGARVYSQVTVQRVLLEVSRVLVPGPGQAPRARGLASDFHPAPPGQRESVRVGDGDGKAKEEGGRRPASRGYLTTPGCSTRCFGAAPGKKGPCRLPPPPEVDPWRRLQTCPGSGLPPSRGVSGVSALAVSGKEGGHTRVPCAL